MERAGIVSNHVHTISGFSIHRLIEHFSVYLNNKLKEICRDIKNTENTRIVLRIKDKNLPKSY